MEFIYTEIGNIRPCYVMPVAVNLPALHATLHPLYKKRVFFIGSLDYMPNQEGLIWFVEKVWKRYFHNTDGVAFHIAGRNAPGKLKKYLKNQPVNFIGEVDNASHFMQEGGIMVAPVFSGGGIRVKIIEAMANGIPVVSTTIGAEGLDVTNNENIMVADTPEKFAESVNKLLENQTFFAKIGENAKKFIRGKMDGHKLTNELMNFYQTIV